MTYPAGKRVYSVETPVRKRYIKQLARRSNRAFSSTITKDSLTSTKVIYELSKKIKGEMQEMSSQSFDSLLNDKVEAVKHFHWETVHLECEKGLPTLMALLKNLIAPHATNKVPIQYLLLNRFQP